jgi:hypothetical protein
MEESEKAFQDEGKTGMRHEAIKQWGDFGEC